MKKTTTRLLLSLAFLVPVYLFAQPANDNSCDAQTLMMGTPVTGTFTDATLEPDEASPPMTGDCYSDWCDGSLDATVWFTFTAPASGYVRISSCSDNNNSDTQFALYEVPGACNDFVSFVLLGANDDIPEPCTAGGSEYASELFGCGLTPGVVYYLQLDTYNGDGGDFEVTVTEEPECPVYVAFMQFMHASADASVETVDIRIDGELIVDDLSFEEATGMIEIPLTADVFTINPANSTDDSNPLFMLEDIGPGLIPNMNLVVAVTGIYDEANYDISAVGSGSFGITGIDFSMPGPGNLYLNLIHTVTDTLLYYYDNVDFAGGPVIFNEVLGGETSGLTDAPFDLRGTDISTLHARFLLPFDDYNDGAIALVITGFIDTALNNNGPPLKACIVEPDGTVTCYDNIYLETEENADKDFNVYPNPAHDVLTVVFNTTEDALIELISITGQTLYKGHSGDLEQEGNDIRIPVASLADGTYQLRITRNGQVSYQHPVVIAH